MFQLYAVSAYPTLRSRVGRAGVATVLVACAIVAATLLGCRPAPQAKSPEASTSTNEAVDTNHQAVGQHDVAGGGDVQMAAGRDHFKNSDTGTLRDDNGQLLEQGNGNTSRRSATTRLLPATRTSKHKEPAFPASGSRQRMVVLAPGGPLLLELAVSVADMDLEQAYNAMLEWLLIDAADGEALPSLQWAEFLAGPLVRSGWIGPPLLLDDAGLNEVVARSDQDRDGKVSVEELSQWLKRQSNRSFPLSVRDIGVQAELDYQLPAWGPADANNDNRLTGEEAAAAPQQFTAYDADGSGAITRSDFLELMIGASDAMQEGGNRLLAISSSVPIAPQLLNALDETVGKTTQRVQASSLPGLVAQLRQRDPGVSSRALDVVRRLRNYYSSLLPIDRRTWSNWSDRKWKSFDLDGDGQASMDEMLAWLVSKPDVTVWFDLNLPAIQSHTPGDVRPERMADPAASGSRMSTSRADRTEAQASIRCRADGPALREFAWNENHRRARLDIGSCLITFEVEDRFGAGTREALRQFLAAAVDDSQVWARARDALDLTEAVLALMDSDGNRTLDDAEFDRVWRWLHVRGGVNVNGQWAISSLPWFDLLDFDANDQLSALEQGKLPELVERFDRDGDDSLLLSEMPLVVTCRLQRGATLFPDIVPPMAASQKVPAGALDWFAASDANGDGILDRTEFLGETTDFLFFDRNGDRILERSEVNMPPNHR